jgi:hypothetical protein
MVQCCEDLRLATEPSDAFGVLRERRWQHLDGDITIELRIARAEHLAHPTRADRADDFVGSESCPRGHGHGATFRWIKGETRERPAKSRSRWRTPRPLWIAQAAIRQSTLDLTVTPARRAAR